MNSNYTTLPKLYGMRLLTLLFLMIASQSVALSQQLKTTYYDPYTETKIKEKYYVNSVGEKNGSYTLYEQNGVVWTTANYKNGKLDGVRKSYNSSSGVQIPVNSETYQEGVLEGAAKYYTPDGKVVRSEGMFINGKREGVWTFHVEYINYDLSKEEKKGCEYYTASDNYSNDKALPISDGVTKYYFYPSGKIYQELEYANGQVGNSKSYFPDGTLRLEKQTNGNSRTEKEYWLGGQLKASGIWENGKQIKYEGYKKDGSPDATMQAAEQEAEKNKKKLEAENRVSVYIDSAANAIKSGNVKKAIEYYTTVGLSSEFIARFNQLWDKYQTGTMPTAGFDSFEYRYDNVKRDYSFDDKNGTPVAQLNYAESVIKKNTEKLNRIKEMETLVNSKVEKYKSLYVVSKNSFFVDANNNPIVKETYPKGEYIFKKSSTILQEYLDEFRNETSSDNKLEKGLTVAEKLDAMIKLGETDTEEINKKLKKIESKDEIIALLGL